MVPFDCDLLLIDWENPCVRGQRSLRLDFFKTNCAFAVAKEPYSYYDDCIEPADATAPRIAFREA